MRVIGVRGVVVGGCVALLVEFRDLQPVILLLIFELRDHLARANQLFVLIVEALESMATDTSFFPVELLCVVQNRSVLGDHIRSVALLAPGLEVLRIIQRPEPVFVPAMRLLNGVKRAPVPAVARRAAKFFQGMIFHHVLIGVACIRRVLALVQAQVGFRHRHRHGHDQWIRSEMAGLAAVDQSGAAQVIERRAGGVHVDLAELDIEFFHAPGEGLQIARGQAWELLLHVFAEFILRVFFRLIHLAALGDKFCLRGHDRSEQVI